MAQKKLSLGAPASVAKGSGLLRSAAEVPHNNLNLCVVQAAYVARRFGVSPPRAPLVALLHFGEGRAQ